MFDKILYGTDFSDLATKALDYVKKLKEGGLKEVIVLHIIDEHALNTMAPWTGIMSPTSYKLIAKAEAHQKDHAKKGVKKIKEELESEGLTVKTLIKKGTPYKEIVETADEENVNLIVIGSHGKGILKGALLGSVSENVLRHTNKPILMIKKIKLKK
ncbi:MAG: universal stress protein [Candidatus Ranarchaeia archaeon]